jgi:hypothetical protein
MFSTKKEIEEFLSNKILLRTESSHLKIFPDRPTNTHIFLVQGADDKLGQTLWTHSK